ncbi:MAG TPA: cytochrome c3 family protein [Anaeromyxobacteraceae bacterium]|nr:cytochrome c3 family protein [Anaeromyxobacteraceae bacterium]
MHVRNVSILAAALAALAAPDLARAAPPQPAAAPAAAAPAAAPQYKYPTRRKVDNKPLPPGTKAAVVHAPYGSGECTMCHQSNDPKKPGPVIKAGNALCYDCHGEFEEIMARKYKHPPAVEACTNCHNPHDAKEKKLLHAELASQCLDCHKPIKQIVENAKVKHGALSSGQKCANCHNPHGTNIEKLLINLPFDQCVNCHSVDDMKDWNGVTLTNFKRFLEDNKVWHAPVEAKDCSACHKTHGADNFRLLVAEYPAKFYAAYELKNYALCYGCHNDKVVSEPETTTLTNFRDGSRNLHFVHVNKADRGRTCRACHEVHASKQDHHIRDGVPYGPRGWVLKINFTKTPTGGTCAKTCHETKTYTNKTLSTSSKKK